MRYDGGYRRIGFPGGDVDRAFGVCTDVVIRAYRDAFGYVVAGIGSGIRARETVQVDTDG